MKMTTGQKRLVAVLLAVLMVFSIVPFAALAVNAATIEGSVSLSAFTGQNVTLDSAVTFGYDTSVVETPIYGTTYNKYLTAKLTEYNIDSIIAADANWGTDLPNAVQAASGASVSFTAAASKTAATLQSELQTKLNTTEADDKTLKKPVKQFSSSYRNQLTSIRVSYNGRDIKTLYLYAKVTPHTRTFYDTVSNETGETRYHMIGSVTVYPSSVDMKLSYPSTRIAINQTISMVASVNNGAKVAFDIVPNSITGLANVTKVSGTDNIFQITANGLVTSGNRLTVYAYLMADSSNYIYRAPNGSLVLSTTVPIGVNAQTVDGIANCRPVYDMESVTFSTVAPITSLSFRQSSYTCEVGDSFSTGVTIKPTGATGGVTYTSANPAIATISSGGYVTGVAEGRTTIYATAADGSGISAAATVIVNKATAKVTISRAAMTLSKGEIATLTATVTPVTLVNRSVYWTSSNTSVATVSNGTVLAVGEGTAMITATYTADSKKTAVCYVTVNKAEAKITVKDNLSVKVGETVNLNASISETENKTLIYASDNNAVVKVDANGNVTGMKAGSAMITVTSAANTEIKAYCIVIVTGESGVIKETTKYVAGSNYYRSSDVSSADVKTAITQLKGAKSIDVTVDVTSESDMNKVVITRYAAARLAKYADSLIVKVDNKICVFDSADLAKMDIGRPVYVYVTPDKVTVKYKNTSGVYKTIKVTPEVTEK